MHEQDSKVNPFILIVEDSDADFEAVKRAFKKAETPNFLRRCITGEEALEFMLSEDVLSGKNRPSLIVLDLNLPGMGGISFLKKIKQNTETKSVPVIIFSTSDSDEDIRACYQYGANSYIRKPVNINKLYSIVGSIKEYWFQISALPNASS